MISSKSVKVWASTLSIASAMYVSRLYDVSSTLIRGVSDSAVAISGATRRRCGARAPLPSPPSSMTKRERSSGGSAAARIWRVVKSR